MRRYGKILLLLTLTCIFMLALTADASAEGILDDTRFPDMALRQALSDKYGDGHHNVNLLREDLNLTDCGIRDLTGLELFTNLITLDVSGNELESLAHLSDCKKLATLDCRDNPIATLNMDDYPSLRVLLCSGRQLTTLSLQENRATLQILTIENTGLTALDLSNFEVLEGVTCLGGSLTGLNVSGCSKLASVTCTDCPLSSVELTGCTALEFLTLDCCGFTSLSVNDLDALKALSCKGNSTLSNLSVSNCPKLEEIVCSDCSLQTLSTSGNGKLTELYCQNNKFTALAGIPTLYTLNCSNNQLTSLGSFPDLVELDCSRNRLTALSIPAGLWSIDCAYNVLTTLDLSASVELYYANCAHNALTSIEIGGCEELDMLYAHDNRLASIDVENSALSALTWVGHSERDGMEVMIWQDDFTFDVSTTLVRGETVIYSPGSQETPLPEFFLPYALVTIGDEAFSGIAAEAVLIPETVTTITGNPFAGSKMTHIYGYSDSAAENFVRTHTGYTFVSIGEGD